jgi:hypothetical protein
MAKIYDRFSDKENFESTGNTFRRKLKEEPYGKIGYGIGVFEVIVIVLGIFLLYPSIPKFIIKLIISIFK